MAQSGYTPISLYYSTVTGSTPTAGQLVDGEVGLNIRDGKLYYKSAAGAVTLLASSSSPLAIPVTVPQGGTGLTTLASGRIPYGNVTGPLQSSSSLYFNGTTLTVGPGSALGGTTNPYLEVTGNTDAYIQQYIYNANSGTHASADFVAYPDNGLDTSGWVDMGIASSTFADTAFSVTTFNEGYLFMSSPAGAGKSGNLVYATDSTGTTNSHQWYVGGFNQSKSAWKMQLTSTGLQLANALATTYGGTGLTSFTSGGAVYATSTSALTTGTLPVASGGTGQTTYTNGQLLIGNTTGNTLTKATLTQGTGVTITNGNGSITISATGSGGTVTSVGFTGGIISVANGTTTPAFTVAGTSGGIPYFSSGTTWASSAALAANALVVGGGAGVAPSTITTGTGVVTALGVAVGSAGAFVTYNGALGTPSSGSGSNLTFGTGTLSLAGNVTHAGAFTQTFTATGNTSVTLPTSGTLLTTTGSGSSLTFGTGTLSLAGNVTHAGAFTQTFTATGNTSVTLPTSGTLATLAGSETLTNKRVTPRIGTTTSAATITPTSDLSDQYNVTALATTAAFANPSGTPTDGQKLSIRIKDSGSGQTMSWSSSTGGYRAIGTTLPTSIAAGKTIYVGCVYNSADSFWDVVAVATQT